MVCFLIRDRGLGAIFRGGEKYFWQINSIKIYNWPKHFFYMFTTTSEIKWWPFFSFSCLSGNFSQELRSSQLIFIYFSLFFSTYPCLHGHSITRSENPGGGAKYIACPILKCEDNCPRCPTSPTSQAFEQSTW